MPCVSPGSLRTQTPLHGASSPFPSHDTSVESFTPAGLHGSRMQLGAWLGCWYDSAVSYGAPALLGATYAALARAGRPAAANYPLVATAAAAFALLVFAPPRRKKLGGTLSEALLATDAISC